MRELWNDPRFGLLTATAAFLVALAVIVGVPAWLLQVDLAVTSGEATPAERLSLVNDYRRTVLQAIGGLAVLWGLYLTSRRIRVTEDGQITERFTNAIAQLGDDELEVRLGGIYALERIAVDSPKDHWTIMEILSAFVRENAGPNQADSDHPTSAGDPPEEATERKLPNTDVQATLTVLGRRKVEYDKPGERLNLRKVYLWTADLREAELREANLREANLREANLQGADLQKAPLWRANLQGANLWGANLRGAEQLTAGQLRQAENLTGAKLDKDLRDALPDNFL